MMSYQLRLFGQRRAEGNTFARLALAPSMSRMSVQRVLALPP
jgi:hypothetical protein